MKTSLFVTILLLSTLFLISCSKNKDNDGPAQVFSWRADGGTEVFSDTTSFLRLFGVNSIFAKKGTTSIFISTNSTNPGLYSTFSANGGAGLSIAGTQYGCVSALVNISSNSDGRLNGNFSAEMIVANVDTINLTGAFSNIRYY